MSPPSRSKVSVKVNGRIHIGLISMHEDARRINGGVGFGVRGIGAMVEASIAEQTSLSDNRIGAFSISELDCIRENLVRASNFRRWSIGADVRFSGNLATHVGLGSGTALRLAAIEALSILNDDPLSKEDLVQFSGRGGTSGIGIHSYFHGGLFLDVGVVREERDFAPSSQLNPTRVPSIIPRLTLPDWNMIACLPKNTATKSQAEEVAFFAETAPIPEPASHEAAYVALFDIYASAMDADYAGFCRGVKRMQDTYWKAAEIRQYGEQLSQLMCKLDELGADCSGLSSLGPTIFALGSEQAVHRISSMANELDCIVIPLSANAAGRQVVSN